MGKSTVVVLMTALVAYMSVLTAAQTSGGIPSCASKLAPCFNFLNATTTPPTSCCEPLKEAVTNERKCLCDIYNNPVLIQTFHINVTQALNLITLCHIDTVKDTNICKAQSPSSSVSPSTGSTPTTPGSASTNSPPANAAAKISGDGSAGLISILLMFGGYIMFY